MLITPGKPPPAHARLHDKPGRHRNGWTESRRSGSGHGRTRRIPNLRDDNLLHLAARDRRYGCVRTEHHGVRAGLRRAFQQFRGGPAGGPFGPGRPVSTGVSVSACPYRGTVGAPNPAAESVICPVSIDVCEVSEGGLEPSGTRSQRPGKRWAAALKPVIAGVRGSRLGPVKPGYLGSVPDAGHG
jgi:hypothetical protein